MNHQFIARLFACASVVAAFTLGTRTATAATWYVSPTGSDAAAGTNWATAKLTLQAGLNAANANDTVLVTNGVYATGVSSFNAWGGQYNQRAAFVNSTNVTLQSVNGPAVTVIDGGTNTGCVLFYQTIGGRLSGFTLTHGYSLGPLDFGKGAAGLGIFLSRSVLVDNCWMVDNRVTSGAGAGVSMLDAVGYGGYSNRIVNCVISGNSSAGSGNAASGVYLALGAYAHELTFDNCIIASNACGGVYIDGSQSDPGLLPGSLVFNNCNISQNYAQGNATLGGNGSAVWAFGNTAGICSLNNCTVAGNVCSPGARAVVALGTATNSIFFGNTDTNGGAADWDGSGTLAYCCTPGIAIGSCNRTNAPAFVSPGTGNFRLSPFESPCINAGLNTAAPGKTDLDGGPRIRFGGVDIGCYESQFALLGLGTNGALDVNALNALLNNPRLITNASSTNALYTLSQLQALNVNSPLLAKGTNGQFSLTIGVQRSTNLTNFTAFPLNSADASAVIDGAGNLQFTFPGSEDAAFFRVQSQ